MKKDPLPDLQELKVHYNASLNYIAYLREQGWMDDRKDLSKFWKEVFEDPLRQNYPGFEEMLRMRHGATYPLADRMCENGEADEAYARAAYAIIRQTVPQDYFGGWKESPVGAPIGFEFNGHYLSAGAIISALTSYRIIELCRKRKLFNRPLRVLEIGSGYGQAACQLLQQLSIQSYVICDLPENLFLSAFYLPSSFPEKKAAFLKEEGVVDPAEDLVFLIPAFLQKMKGPFDLVINSYSFQEMSRSSVEDYFHFTEKTLAADGVFYSLNAHGKDEIRWPSDYPVERFHLLSILPVRKSPFQVFATNPYEMVMEKRGNREESGDISEFRDILDALGASMQLGLHDEILDLCQKFTAGNLEMKEKQWLQRIGRFFREDPARKEETLTSGPVLQSQEAVNSYLQGSFEFSVQHWDAAQGFLENIENGLADSHARVRTHLLLACLAYGNGKMSEGDEYYNRAVKLAPHLREEISHFVADCDILSRLVADQMGFGLSDERAAPTGIFQRLKRKWIQHHIRQRESVAQNADFLVTR